MRSQSSSSPLHVHLTDNTPVHVHVKSQKKSPARIPQGNTKRDRGKLLPTAKVKTHVPWIPPGKVSTKDATYKWEGPTHCLEITPLAPESEPEYSHCALHIADLMPEEEEALHGQISQYERKIDDLRTEVNSLKNEVQLQKKEQLLQRQLERLSASQMMIAEQEEELAEVTREVDETERENTQLRQSMEKMLGEDDFNKQVQEKDLKKQDKETLLRNLTAAERDGAAAAKQVLALCDSVSKVRGKRGSRLSDSELSVLANQKELLLQKLETFDATNRTLRHLLREQHGCQTESIRLAEQKDTLRRRLTDAVAENTHLVVKLEEKEREVNHLSRFLDTEKGLEMMRGWDRISLQPGKSRSLVLKMPDQTHQFNHHREASLGKVFDSILRDTASIKKT
ncbi:hypothetical protein LDENG_00197770 [Lucifuga dentata]|nr:hypothetical protein LDENG_00197770 [Lucifuga dentata]